MYICILNNFYILKEIYLNKEFHAIFYIINNFIFKNFIFKKF